MKDFDAAVFDMDGVIFDSERAVLECWLFLAQEYGFRDMEKPYFASIGTNMARTKEIMLDAYGADFPYDAYAIEDSYNGIRAASRGCLRPIMVPDLLPQTMK